MVLQNIKSKLHADNNIIWVYIISISFVVINALCLAFEFYYFSLLPIMLLFVVLALFSLDRLFLILVFFVPLSISLKTLTNNHFSFDVSLPAEPIILGIFGIFLFKLLTERKFDKKIAYHPISIVIYINIFWIFMTSITSSMPLVSFKFLAARMWFVVAFYFVATQVFANPKNIKRYLWLYILPFIIVIVYTIINHASHGLNNRGVANWVVKPFYNDHTSYGAVIAMFIPVLVGFAVKSKYKFNVKIFIWIVLAIFIVALVLSYSRAAWLSLAGAVGVYILILFRVKLRMFIFGGIVAIGLLFAYQDQLLMKLEQNRQDSSTDLADHVKSISNVATDASNLERINRWKCAIRMFQEKPIMGWGPGTYMFKYAPFQFSYERTIISTNAADWGNAHSEYIGPLAESGFLGSITIVLIFLFTVITAIKVYYRTKDTELKLLIMGMLLGLVTYYLHGFLNNFLETDKASAPFWGFVAVIVAIDVYHTKSSQKSVVKSQTSNN